MLSYSSAPKSKLWNLCKKFSLYYVISLEKQNKFYISEPKTGLLKFFYVISPLIVAECLNKLVFRIQVDWTVKYTNPPGTLIRYWTIALIYYLVVNIYKHFCPSPFCPQLQARKYNDNIYIFIQISTYTINNWCDKINSVAHSQALIVRNLWLKEAHLHQKQI